MDGRLIIAEPKRGDAADSDSDDAEDTIAGGAQKRQLDSDSDDEDAGAAVQQSRKRKAMDSHSMASGRTGGSSNRYQTGGKGIHRSTSGASVKSGISRASMATTKSAASTAAFGGGDAFRAKKAKGDMKKKGKMDPYAYIPLSRTSMNKR